MYVKGIVLVVLLGILTVAAFYSIPKSAESLRWSTADGYDCEETGTSTYTCCKKITFLFGYVTVSATRCVDCEYSIEGTVSCGNAYHAANAYHTAVDVAVNSVDTGGVVDPKIKNYAKDLIGQGLALLNDRTQKGGQVDPKVMNSANALIGKSLTILTKGETKGGTVDPKVTKDASVLINRILSADKMITQEAQNIKVPKTGALDDSPVLTENGTDDTSNQTQVPEDRGGLNGNGPTINPDLQ